MISKSNNFKNTSTKKSNKRKELSWINGDYDYYDYYNIYSFSYDYDFEIDLGYLEDDINEFTNGNNSTLDYPEDLYF